MSAYRCGRSIPEAIHVTAKPINFPGHFFSFETFVTACLQVVQCVPARIIGMIDYLECEQVQLLRLAVWYSTVVRRV